MFEYAEFDDDGRPTERALTELVLRTAKLMPNDPHSVRMTYLLMKVTAFLLEGQMRDATLAHIGEGRDTLLACFEEACRAIDRYADCPAIIEATILAMFTNQTPRNLDELRALTARLAIA